MKTSNYFLLSMLFLIGVLSCKNQKDKNSQENNSEIVSEEKQPLNQESKIITKESFGPVNASTTLEDLQKLYGKQNIREVTISNYEGILIKGSEVTFDNTANNFTIEWNEAKSTPKIITVKSGGSMWKTVEGIGIGSTIMATEKANKVPFIIYGYEIDGSLAGTIKTWNAGNLQGIQLQFKTTKDLPQEDYLKIMGDEGLLSSNSLLEQAGLQVEKIAIVFNP